MPASSLKALLLAVSAAQLTPSSLSAMCLKKVSYIHRIHLDLHVQTTPQWLINAEFLNETAVYNGIHGHKFLFIVKSTHLNESLLLGSADSYLTLKKKFIKDLDHEELK